MYQNYYAKHEKRKRPYLNKRVSDVFCVTGVRFTIWQEHCLECGAPECYIECGNYLSRRDGRCQLFANSISVFNEKVAIGGKGAHLRYRKWGNLMTTIYPEFITLKVYKCISQMFSLQAIFKRALTHLPITQNAKWKIIHLWDRKLGRGYGEHLKSNGKAVPDAFIFHGYSYNNFNYNLLVEIYDRGDFKCKISIPIEPGENLHILSVDNLTSDAWKYKNFLKVYPENDIAADIEIYWCDFVKGHFVNAKPSDKVKCVVWDLDNTIWDGVPAEFTNGQKTQLRPQVKDIIDNLDKRGILQSVASKNDYEFAWNTLVECGIADYFLCPQINWGAKSNSLRVIAKQLDIGLDSFALVDDSPFEREEVQYVYPQIRVFDPKNIQEMISSEAFDVPITSEAKNRRKMYQAEFVRSEYRSLTNVDNILFIKECQLVATPLRLNNESTIQRCYELVQRTNQLNSSGTKYKQDVFISMLNDDNYENIAFKFSDKFGEYGISCYIRFHFDERSVTIDEFAMSCRVARKFIENAILIFLLHYCEVNKGFFKIVKTEKNTLLRESLREMGCSWIEDSEKEIIYSFDENVTNHDIIMIRELEEKI